MWKLVLAFVLIVVVSGGVLVGVADAAAPGDLLYGLDRGMETLRSNLTTNPARTAQWNLALAQERYMEVQQLAQRGDLRYIDQALGELSRALQATGSPASEAVDQAAAALREALNESSAGSQGNGPKEKDKNKDKGPKDKEKDKDGDKGADDGPKEPNDGAYCSGSKEKHHPTGDKLAERYGVSYEKIMAWFCQGYGFGEVDLAYTISQKAQVPVEEVFALRASGMGWGEILQQYGLSGKPGKDKDKDKEKPKAKPTKKP